MGGRCCGGCGDRRIYLLFLSITVFQIIITIARWVIDFLGPLWSMILTDFLNIVFAILGFSGGYAQIKNYLFTYIIWSLLWLAWNVFIILLYVPLPQLEIYKSVVLSLGTGGFSYWETRAPGCVPDWESENKLIVTNCMFDPKLMEFIQGGLQVLLSLSGIVSAFIILCRNDFDGVQSKKKGKENGVVVPATTVPSFLGRSPSGSRGTLRSTRGARTVAQNGDSSDQVTANDDRLRPMTPRRVKRRSARSIQSQKFGRERGGGGDDRPGTSRNATAHSSSARSSLRSNASSARRSHRSSKRKQHQNQFISPVNRLMQQVQVDSEETSHEEPGRYSYHNRDQGHVNPVYVGPQSPDIHQPPPPRPPSARSSYSNYHPARLPQGAGGAHPNVFNLNQNIFTNGGFDMSTEYNVMSQQTSEAENNSTNGNNLYEEDVNFLPDPHPARSNANFRPPPLKNTGTMNTTTTLALTSPPQSSNASSSAATATTPKQFPNGFTFSFNPHQQKPPSKKLNNNHIASPGGNYSNTHANRGTDNHQTFAYPLAHSPVSQESFPMWGISQPPQSPVVQNLPIAPSQAPSAAQRSIPLKTPPYQNPPSFQPRTTMGVAGYARQHHQHLQPHPTSSETVI